MPAAILKDMIQLPTEPDELTTVSIWDGKGEHIVGRLSLWLGSIGSVYIGWSIDEEHRGKGYATSAAQQAIPHLLLHFHRVVAVIASTNGASSNVARRAGMRFEGTAKEGRWNFKERKWEDIEFWAALESDI